MTEQIAEKSQDNFVIKRSLRTKLNIYLALIVVITISLFDILALRSNHDGVLIHVVHAVVTVLLIIALVNFMFSKLILNPLNDLIRAMTDMEEGKFATSLEAENKRNDEIGWLIDRFCEMRRNLQQLVRSEKKESASAVAYRVQRELRDPITNLEKNIKSLRSTLNTIDPSDSWGPVKGIIYSIEKDLNSIKTFSDEVSSTL